MAPTEVTADAGTEIATRLDRLPLGRWHARIVALMGVGTFFNFFEVGLGSALVTLLPAGWVTGTLAKSLVIASAFAGELIGALLLAPLSDRFGRRTMFQVNLLAYAGLALVSVFSPTLGVFVAIRVLMGVGLGAELVLVDTYLSELVPAAKRGRMIAIAYVVGWLAPPVTMLLATLLPHDALGIGSWRCLLVFSALGAGLVGIVRRRIPESPRWLATVGRVDEARAAVRDIERASPEPAGTPAAPAPAPRETDDGPRPRMLRPPVLGRTALACVIWFCQTIGVHGFTSIAPLVLIHKGFDVVESLGYTAISAVGNPVGALLVVPLVERVQRKHLLVVSSVLVAAAGATYGLASSVALIVVAGALLNIANVVMGDVSHAYSAELFPTSIRTTAAGRTYSLSRLTSAVLPFVTLPLLYSLGAGTLFAVCAALIVAMSVTVALRGPRTNSRRLDTI